MPLSVLKLYIQNRRGEKLIRGEVQGIIDYRRNGNEGLHAHYARLVGQMRDD